MTSDERLNKIEEKIKEHDDKIIELEKRQLTDRFELSNLITEAVNKAIEPLIKKIEAQDKRINTLENAEANKALENKKQFMKCVTSVIISVIVTFFASVILNNLISIIASQPVK